MLSRIKHKPIVAPRTAALVAELEACLKREAFYIAQKDGQSLLEQMNLKTELITALQHVAGQRVDPWLNERFKELVAQQNANAAAIEDGMHAIQLELEEMEKAQNRLHQARRQSRSLAGDAASSGAQFWA